MTPFGPRVVSLALASLASVACLVAVVAAQPPLGQMSGIPLPSPELPDGTITVRVIRGAVTNNVTGQEVQLRQGDSVETATTDSEGRATFLISNAGQQVQASTVLDSQLLQSQSFAVPGRGGVRVMLVGADRDVPVVPSRAGTVTFGEESWAQIELVEESVEVYYFFEVVNPGNAPVDSAVPIVLDLPDGAEGTTVLQGSSPRTVASGSACGATGAFRPGGDAVARCLHLAVLGREPRRVPAPSDRLGLGAGVCREVGHDGLRVEPGRAPDGGARRESQPQPVRRRGGPGDSER